MRYMNSWEVVPQRVELELNIKALIPTFEASKEVLIKASSVHRQPLKNRKNVRVGWPMGYSQAMKHWPNSLSGVDCT